MNKRAISGREAALLILNQTEQEAAYLNLAAGKVFGRFALPAPDRGFASELSYGVVRNRIYLDYALAQFIRLKSSKISLPIRNILRLSAYQLLFLTDIPQSAVCNEAVKLARRYGHEGSARFANGVLRSMAREPERIVLPARDKDPAEFFSVRYSMPRWLVDKFAKDFGWETASELIPAFSQRQSITLRANRLRIDRDALQQSLCERGVLAEACNTAPDAVLLSGAAESPAGMDGFREGLFSVQGVASQLAALALYPSEGARVLDLCAAPGGKTTYLAELMQNRGEIVALDVHPHKTRLIEENARRLGLNCIRALEGDAAVYRPEWKSTFDYVLCDVPCSGLGVLAKKPDIKYNKKTGDFTPLIELQERILENAALYIRPGGTIVYATCTINPEENIYQVRRFLERHPEFCLSPLPEEFNRLSGVSAEDGYAQLFPHLHGTDGFFISKITR